jgi:CheY-like chemotaxis protein
MNDLPKPFSTTTATVLVAEGDALVRLALAQYLRECGYKVVEANTTDEALTVLESPEVSVDVVLCAVDLGGAMDGFGLARWVRSSGRRTKVVLAGSNTRAASAAGELCENGPMMKKPYDHKLLGDHIKRLLAERDRSA